MIRQIAIYAPIVALWVFLWVYTNDMAAAERAAFWAMIGLG